MTEKDLKSYQSTVREMKQIQEKIKELQQSKYTIKSMIISDMNVQTSHNNNSIEELLIKTEEEIEKYWDKYRQLLELQNKIEDALEKLDPLEREVLRYRYFYNKKFEEIACITNYSYRTVRRIYKRGIIKLEKKE